MKHARFRLYTRFRQYFDALLFILGLRRFDGQKVVLEQAMGRALDRPAVAVNQCRIGIYYVVSELIKRTGRREILMSPYTLFDVINMVIVAGGRPRFIDIGRASLHPDMQQIRSAIRDYGKNIAGFLLTHYHQPWSDLDALGRLLKENGIPLLEDCAIAFSGSFAGRPLGTFGDYSFFSFGRMKNVATFYGGAVATDDEAMLDSLRDFQQSYPILPRRALVSAFIYSIIIEAITHPLLWTLVFHPFFHLGYRKGIRWIEFLIRPDKDIQRKKEIPTYYKFRISEVQCRMITRGLKRVDQDRNYRTRAAQFYYENLQGIPELQLPMNDIRKADPFLEFPILSRERDSLFLALQAAGIDCRKYYYRNCAEIPAFEEFAAPCPNVTALEESLLMLSVYPGYPVACMEKAVKVIKEYFASRHDSKQSS